MVGGPLASQHPHDYDEDASMTLPARAQPADMTAEEFRSALGERGLDQRGFAHLSGRNERTIRRYALGETPVPKWVDVLLAATKRTA